MNTIKNIKMKGLKFYVGTCNNSNWRNELIPLLKIDYFNPLVDDWTEDCYKHELEERKNSDFCLYTITPKMSGVYSIAEVIDDSNKRPQSTILVLLEIDDSIEFTEGQWKSLIAVAKMVSSNGGKVFTNLKVAAIYLNDA